MSKEQDRSKINETLLHNQLPWMERVTMLSINPDAANRNDIARMAAELSDPDNNERAASIWHANAIYEDWKHQTICRQVYEKALEDIRALCISSTYWNNPEYPNCARLLKQHHKIVRDAQVKAAEMRAIEYGDDVEVPIGERS